MCRVHVSGACMCRESSTVANAASIGDHDAISLVVMSVEQVLNIWVPHGIVVTLEELSFPRGGLGGMATIGISKLLGRVENDCIPWWRVVRQGALIGPVKMICCVIGLWPKHCTWWLKVSI